MEILKLAHRRNFRDIGGVRTKDGRLLKKFMLIRGTTLRKLSLSDINLLKEMYKIHTIIDLRTKKESSERPDKIPDGVVYYHYPILTEAVVGISHERKTHSLLSLSMMPHMEELYSNMVKGECLDRLVEVLKKILTLPEKDYAVVFHCTAGKDRTGILAALLLAFLGVGREEILDDYLFTNKVTQGKAKFIYLGVLISKQSHKIANKIRQYYIAKRDYIESAIKSLKNDYGSLENFFDQRLNFTAEEKEAIKNKFLE